MTDIHELSTYYYTGKDLFQKHPRKENNAYENIYICGYDVVVDGKYPFLRFLLSKTDTPKLNFPLFNLFRNLDTTEMIKCATSFLHGMLLINNIDNFKQNVDFNGFYEFDGNLYLFFDITKCDIIIRDIYSNSLSYLALLDEIVNHKKVLNMSVCDECCSLFIHNHYLSFLKDITSDKKEIYETPKVNFSSKPENKLNFTYVFGEIKQNNEGILGPYYYFYDYYTSYQKSFELTELGGPNFGIVRFATFTGKTKFIENNINDEYDKSEMKQQRLTDDKVDVASERLLMRVSDYAGIWANDYDSASLTELELDNGKIIKPNATVLRDFNQQIPISYHYVDLKNKYFIL